MKSLGIGTALGRDNIRTKASKTESLTKLLMDVSHKAEVWDRSGIVSLPQKSELTYTNQNRH